MKLPVIFFLITSLLILSCDVEEGVYETENFYEENEETSFPIKSMESLGSTQFEETGWTDGYKTFQEEMHYHTRKAVMSAAFEECIEDSVIDLYNGSECQGDPFENSPVDTQIDKIIEAARTPWDVQVSLGGTAIASTTLGDYGTSNEFFKWGDWFDLVYWGQIYKNNRKCADGEDPEIDHCYVYMEPYPFPYNEGAGTIIHELMHRQGYGHGDNNDNVNAISACGAPSTGWHFQVNTVPYFTGHCISETINRMSHTDYAVANVTGSHDGGRADLLMFKDDGTYAAVSHGDSFGTPYKWINDFGYNRGWRKYKHVRTAADVNNDGCADIVGFGENGVYVALSKRTSTGRCNYTHGTKRWSTDFNYNRGWRKSKHVRRVADVDNDGCADIIGFGEHHVFVAKSNCVDAFGPTQVWYSDFTYANGGWRTEKHAREVGDVDNDGRADIVAFGQNKVFVAKSNGSKFIDSGVWHTDFTYDNYSWRTSKHIRKVANVNGGAGWADIVGFGGKNVLVAKSNGDNSFQSTQAWLNNLTDYSGGWNVVDHFRDVADVTGDGKADVIGVSEWGVFVGKSLGSRFEPVSNWLDMDSLWDGYYDIYKSQFNVSIPDDSTTGITRYMRINTSYTNLDRSRVKVNILHTFKGDLVVTLTSPSGTTKTLHNRSGGSVDNVFIDESLDNFSDENSLGVWQLNVSDNAPVDEGQLTNWIFLMR